MDEETVPEEDLEEIGAMEPMEEDEEDLMVRPKEQKDRA